MTEADFNKIIEIKEREAHRVKLFMDQIDQSEKTLVFCATQDHALAVRDLINQMKTAQTRTIANGSPPTMANSATSIFGTFRTTRRPSRRFSQLAKALDRRGCSQHPQYRPDAPHQLA